MTALRSIYAEEGKTDVHDPEVEPTEQEILTPNFLSGVKVLAMGEVIHGMAWTDMPGSRHMGMMESRVAERWIMSRTTARKLYRDLGKLLNAGN